MCKLLDSLELLQQKHVFLLLQNVRTNSKVFLTSIVGTLQVQQGHQGRRRGEPRAFVAVRKKNNGKKLGSKSFANTFQALEEISSRWWFQRFFIFIPTWGNDPIWLKIFQIGWNHQLELNMPKNINFGFSECCIFWWIRTARFYLLLAV